MLCSFLRFAYCFPQSNPAMRELEVTLRSASHYREMKFLVLLLSLSILSMAQLRTPVLIELFTAEGCGACPPADELISAIDQLQPIPNADLIVLSEHVTYWDASSKDRFATTALTNRQLGYSKLLKIEGVYTPQLIIDGQYECTGGNGPEAKRLILEALKQPKPLLELTAFRSNGKIKTNVSFFGLAGATVLVAIAENQAETKVTKGENAGKTLKHTAVVRALHTIGTAEGLRFDSTVELPSPPIVDNFRVVAFAQDSKTGRILAVAQSKL
jgi:hypothetical protein